MSLTTKILLIAVSASMSGMMFPSSIVVSLLLWLPGAWLCKQVVDEYDK